MKTLTAICAIAILTGCGNLATAPRTHPDIARGGFVVEGAENTPIDWNGTLLIVVNTGNGFYVLDFSTRSIISKQVITKMDTVSAIVDSGTLYVFGSNMITPERSLSPGGQILMVSSTNLLDWSQPVSVIQAAPDLAIGNTSVTKSPDGFVMAYDTRAPGYADYSYRFAYSKNLTDWIPIGGVFSPDEYTSCPAIRYEDGYYYVFHLRRRDKQFVTMVSRSTDLISFENQRSEYAVLSPVGHPEDGNATTDLDLVEFGWIVYLTYSAGDQQTWGHIKYATYNGSLKKLMALYF